jgi:hypothetical protein
MKFPNLKIVKTENAAMTWGDCYSSEPQVGDGWRNRHPATYNVTGPSGLLYTVKGSTARFMQSPEWYYVGAFVTNRGGFKTREACLVAIDKLETTTL